MPAACMSSEVLWDHFMRGVGRCMQDMLSELAGGVSSDASRRPASGGAGSSAELAEIDARLHALQSFLKAAKASCDLVH
jgi:hypothetical protein